MSRNLEPYTRLHGQRLRGSGGHVIDFAAVREWENTIGKGLLAKQQPPQNNPAPAKK